MTKSLLGSSRSSDMVSGTSVARNLAALGLELAPAYSIVLFTRLTRGRSFSLHEMVFYPLVVGTANLLIILALLRFVCGQPPSALNVRPASWRRDWTTGTSLTVMGIVMVSRMTR
jgi:hypothetical protein